ncbi:MAG: hypothetical protein MMC33_003418 [Icmadophila ericetorum]|nr:hypothetical protein [Icmadophila ericetorum]
MALPTQQACAALLAPGGNARLNGMRRVRDIHFRRRQRNCNLGLGSSGSYIIAIVGQQRGRVERICCARCRNGHGPFTQCVRVRYHDGTYAMNGSCANCYYHRWGGCTSRNANTTTNPATLLLANTSQTSAPAPNPLGAQLAPAPQLSSATQLGPVNFPPMSSPPPPSNTLTGGFDAPSLVGMPSSQIARPAQSGFDLGLIDPALLVTPPPHSSGPSVNASSHPAASSEVPNLANANFAASSTSATDLQ